MCAIVCSVFCVSAQSYAGSKSNVISPRYKGEFNVGYALNGHKLFWDAEYSDSDGEYEFERLGYKPTELSRMLFETIHGVEICPYFFIGAGVGLQYYYGRLMSFKELAEPVAELLGSRPSNSWNALMMPIFADIKLMYPVNEDFSPFLNLGLGGTVGCYSSINCKQYVSGGEYVQKVRGGFYCDFGAGFQYSAFSLSVGLLHQTFGIGFKYIDYEDGYYFEEEKCSTKINSFYVKLGVNF